MSERAGRQIVRKDVDAAHLAVGREIGECQVMTTRRRVDLQPHRSAFLNEMWITYRPFNTYTYIQYFMMASRLSARLS